MKMKIKPPWIIRHIDLLDIFSWEIEKEETEKKESSISNSIDEAYNRLREDVKNISKNTLNVLIIMKELEERISKLEKTIKKLKKSNGNHN